MRSLLYYAYIFLRTHVHAPAHTNRDPVSRKKKPQHLALRLVFVRISE